ncbi:histidine kinase [Geomonas sp. Red276]
MATAVGVGHSLRKNPTEAGREAVLMALERGGIEKPDFVFAFATVGYNQPMLIRAIREASSGAPLTGCSSEGIIVQGLVAETNFGICVMAVASDELRFANLKVENITSGPGRAGARLAERLQLLLAPDSIACFLFADGLTFDFDPFHASFLRSIRLDRQLPFFGGLAADNWATRKTYQYHDDEVLSDGISCVLMSGEGRIASGISHGCVPVGTRRTITRCRANIIYEIDGTPALDVLKEYVDDGSASQWNKMALNLCLGFKTPEYLKKEYGEFTVRYIMDKDDREGSVTIQSDVSEGTELWIVRRDKELIREGLLTVAGQIKEQLGDRKPKFVMQFECMGRGKVVFREQEKIDLLAGLQLNLGAQLPWIGFYTYGEIGPIAGYNCIHNFTAVIAAVY